jgi:hypothetical protein
MRAFRTAAAVAAAGTLLATGSLALADSGSAAPKGGSIKIFVTDFGPTTATITITGAIGDYGTIVSTDKNGKVDANGTFQHAKLAHGGLVIDATAFDKKLNAVRPEVNTANCSVLFSGTGASTIVSGTGDYAGATGHVTITATFAGIAKKKASGKCNFGNNAPTLGEFDTITGRGSVSFK